MNYRKNNVPNTIDQPDQAVDLNDEKLTDQASPASSTISDEQAKKDKIKAKKKRRKQRIKEIKKEREALKKVGGVFINNKRSNS